MTCLRSIVIVDHIGLCNIMFKCVGSLCGVEVSKKEIHLPLKELQSSAEKMTLGRVQDAGSETLPDAPGVSLSPPRNPPLLLRLLCSAGDPWGESSDFWLGVERSIGRRRDEGWTDKWERQVLVVWKACRLDQGCQLSKVKMMPHLV